MSPSPSAVAAAGAAVALHSVQSVWWGVTLCLLAACGFVLAVYVWCSGADKDDPREIQRRTLSVSLFGAACIAACLWHCHSSSVLQDALGGGRCWDAVGLRADLFGLLRALVVTSVLVTLWFAGPIVQGVLNRSFSPPDLRSWTEIRSLMVAPVLEEVVFRSVMVYCLVYVGGMSVNSAALVCPLFFGVAHAHFAVDSIRRTGEVLRHVVGALAMLTYTTLFGWVSAFLYVRTGFVVAAILCHAFCNFMGVPQFGDALTGRHRTRLLPAYVFGLMFFVALFGPLTSPSWLFDGLPFAEAVAAA